MNGVKFPAIVNKIMNSLIMQNKRIVLRKLLSGYEKIQKFQ